MSRRLPQAEIVPGTPAVPGRLPDSRGAVPPTPRSCRGRGGYGPAPLPEPSPERVTGGRRAGFPAPREGWCRDRGVAARRLSSGGGGGAPTSSVSAGGSATAGGIFSTSEGRGWSDERRERKGRGGRGCSALHRPAPGGASRHPHPAAPREGPMARRPPSSLREACDVPSPPTQARERLKRFEVAFLLSRGLLSLLDPAPEEADLLEWAKQG